MKARKGIIKRLSAGFMAAVLALAFAPTVAFAAGDTIDLNQKGSITLYKYEGDPTAGLNGYEAGTMSQADLAAKIAGIANKVPMENVKFKYLKVGTVLQYDKDVVSGGVTNKVTKIGYSVDSDTATFLGFIASDVDYTAGGTNYYTASTLQGRLSAKTQSEYETFMTTKGAPESDATDAAGKVEMSNLDVGLYLVVESVYPAGVTATTVPFFVSIPTSDPTTVTPQGVVTDTEWIYDVIAYPKNSSKPVVITKNLVNPDGDESQQDDGQVGDYKKYSVRADVPGSIGNMSVYTITDKLSKGLSYDTVPYSGSVQSEYAVYGIKADGSRTQLASPANFAFTHTPAAGANLEQLTWTFVPASLADPVTKDIIYTGIEIVYTVRINSDAVVAPQGNANDVSLEYSKSTDPGEGTETKHPVELPEVFTYAIDLLKYGNSNESNPLANVTFELRDANDAAVKVSQAADGTYYLDANGAGNVVTTDATGHLYIKGVDGSKAGTTYKLVETATNAGYNLLAEPILVTITSNANTYTADPTGTYIPVTAGTTYYRDEAATQPFVLPQGVAAGDYVNFGTNRVYTKGAGGVAQLVADLYKVEPLQWSANYNMTGGAVMLKVNNTTGFQLPATGGEGALIFLAIGGLIAIVAGSLLFVTRRRRKNNGLDF